MPTTLRFALPTSLVLTLLVFTVLFQLPATSLDLPIQHRLLLVEKRSPQSSQNRRLATIEGFGATVEQNGIGNAVVGMVLRLQDKRFEARRKIMNG